ncbi:MAG: T9SS type A sorting domain-containing protein [Tenacibaculum sp.]|nr:T9SS type A sorting domain-containing protein [Tenacibaculum sp.]
MKKCMHITVLLFLVTLNFHAQSIDQSFGTEGYTFFESEPLVFKLSNDDKINVLTSNRNFIRLTSDGINDESFGSDGIINYSTDNDVIAKDFVIRNDGQIFILSNEFKWLSNSGFSNWVVRIDGYLSNAQKNPNFGGAGIFINNVNNNEQSNYPKNIFLANNNELFCTINISSRGNIRAQNAILKVSEFGVRENKADLNYFNYSPSSTFIAKESNNIITYLNYYFKDGGYTGFLAKYDTNDTSNERLFFQDFSSATAYIDLETHTTNTFILTKDGDDFYAIRKYDENGDLVSDFGVNKRIALFAEGDPNIKIDSEGNLFVIHQPQNVDNEWSISKYSSDGQIDTGFGTNGSTSITFTNPTSLSDLTKIKGESMFVKGKDETTDKYFLVKINLNDATATNPDINISNDFTVYPNPTTHSLNIKINSNTIIKTIEVFNSVGKRVTATKNTTINVSDYSKGLYLVKVTDSENNITYRKVIKI